MPEISIVIVNYNGLHHLEECLASVYAQEYRDFEVVMVDNASADGSVEFTRARFPQVKLILSGSNLGFAGGNNLGFKHCAGRQVLLLNNDTRMEPGCLAELAKAVSAHAPARIFQPMQLDYYQPDKVDSAGDTVYTAFFSFSFTGYPAAAFPEPRPITGACAAAALYPRDLLEQLGGFDEDFFLVYEDLDLSLRARHRGEEILLLPSARVLHKRSASLGKRSALTLYYSERNFPLFVLKNYPASVLLPRLPAFLLMKAFNLLVAARTGMLGVYLKATWDCLRLAPRMLAKRSATLRGSRLPAARFALLLRKGWLRERLAFKRGKPAAP
jgi:GT2 family glycosyltransferase